MFIQVNEKRKYNFMKIIMSILMIESVYPI